MSNAPRTRASKRLKKDLIPNVETLRLVSMGDDSRIKARVLLKKAKAAKLDDVIILGRTDSGELWAESSLNACQSLWLLEMLKEKIFNGNPWSIV